MKHLILLLTLALVSACASKPAKTAHSFDDSIPVQVVGVGSTFSEAKTNGFNRAIEYVVGTVIVTEKESKHDSLTRNEIINHSSGYVDTYTIIREDTVNGRVRLTMDVYIKHSKIANRILNKDKEQTTVNGDQLATQYSTYLNSRTTVTQVINTVLNDYPSRAFTVKKVKSEFLLDNENNARLLITYRLDWNYNYLVSLNEALQMGADDRNANITQNRVLVNSKKPENWLLGEGKNYYFNDNKLYSLIYEKLHVTTVVYAIILDVRDNAISCDQSHHDMVAGGSWLWVQGHISPQSTIDITIDPISVKKLSGAHNIELGVSGDTNYCKNLKRR